MTKRMLIDASHAEETRVVMLDGNRLEDYDVETAARKQLKGNIYLAKIVRVEPSLQAAFVEYGGNRHGFLAFGEIHPDYFQIPVADRQRLIALQEEEAEAERIAEDAARDRETEDAARDRELGGGPRRRALAMSPADSKSGEEVGVDDVGADVADADGGPAAGGAPPGDEEAPLPAPGLLDGGENVASGDVPSEGSSPAAANPHGAMSGEDEGVASAQASHPDEADDEAPEAPELIGGHDEGGAEDSGAAEDPGGDGSGERARRAAARLMRHYKIQEVIRRRQVILVQVVKEERGNKGAALTTYISLAGRYCVLMPNSPRGGGVSRKITAAADRKRLKEITAELAIPRGMAMIVRTAGAQRPRPEIRRDCEYLLRTWDDIRDTTMASVAPALIYEEASLIKRAIRDVYSSDVDEILVEGEDGWRAARGFMRTLMPSHARKVQLWRENQPLFARSNVEGFLDAMLNPTVQLRSGGYLVINQTEALVAIDVNSGRSTRERGIEETALRTNLEAADEVARQLRLRDLAGLVVIDFIDMEARRHNAMVERRVKDALRSDRARIQVGAISHFGLMEMSRQRLRPSLAENSFSPCPHCNGTGLVRGTESSALHVLRAIEAVGMAGDAAEIAVHLASGIALYILNGKREWLAEIERRCAMQVRFELDEALAPPLHRIVKTQVRSPAEIAPAIAARVAAPLDDEEDIVADEFDEVDAPASAAPPAAEASVDAPPTGHAETEEDAGEHRKKRRRRRRRGGKREDEGAPGSELASANEEGEADAGAASGPGSEGSPAEGADDDAIAEPALAASAVAEDAPAATDEAGERPRRRRSRARRPRRDEAEVVPIAEAPPAAYQGPTPANPFVGTFDIFDALERSEEAYMLNSTASAAMVATSHESADAELSIGDDGLGNEPAADATVEFAKSEALVPEPHATAAEPQVELPAEPLREIAEPPSQTEVRPDASQMAGSNAEPQSGSVVQPIVIGADEPARARKGWWRR